MGARELLHELVGAGFSVEAAGDKLVIRPASKLTDELRAGLRQAKPELLALLSDPEVESARAAMHRLGYCDAEAEAQLQAVLQSVPAATVAADLQAIGDERGLPPTKVAEPERYVAPLTRRRSERRP